MARNFKTHLAGQIGEHLVVAELGRLGIVATPFAGNVPDIDVLAYRDGKSVPLQIKANREGSISVDAKRYLDIEFDGDVQTVVGKLDDVDRDLIFVLVSIGEKLGEDRFFVYRQGFLQDLIYDHHRTFLGRHGGVRPRNPQSTHCAYSESDLEGSENNWSIIFEVLEG
jgi:hypothetical protein